MLKTTSRLVSALIAAGLSMNFLIVKIRLPVTKNVKVCGRPKIATSVTTLGHSYVAFLQCNSCEWGKKHTGKEIGILYSYHRDTPEVVQCVHLTRHFEVLDRSDRESRYQSCRSNRAGAGYQKCLPNWYRPIRHAIIGKLFEPAIHTD